MLVVCYGIHKTASTFTYQITRKIFEHFELDAVVLKGVYACHPEKFEPHLGRIDDPDKYLVIKSHGTRTDYSDHLAQTNSIKVLANYRDPREIALSMLDAGETARAQHNNNVMSKVFNLDDAAKQLRSEIKRFRSWTQLEACRQVYYEDVCFNTEREIQKISQWLLGRPLTDADARTIAESFNERKSIMFNKGTKKRYLTDMSAVDSERFKVEFSDFYESFFPNET